MDVSTGAEARSRSFTAARPLRKEFLRGIMIYDPFQQKAIDCVKEGHSVIVSAPTGAGKTVIAEYVINDCLARGEKAVYTAPIKALSNQKFRDFQENFSDRIGILTGDVSINPSAPILIMTTEIFRNKVLEQRSGFDTYSWVIIDEIHYLDDVERGTVWEESLIFLPPHMKLLALSATIPNLEEFAAWLRTIHKNPLRIVKEDRRPVPLHLFYQCQGEICDSLHRVKEVGYRHQPVYHRRGRASAPAIEHLKPNRATTLVKHLNDNALLPCIYFSFSRKRCEFLAEEIGGFDLVDDREKQEIRSLYHRLCERFDLVGEKNAVHLQRFVEKGIAYHHAGMLPTLKEVVERLFTSRLIKVIFTTETFALGINMPARTVVFDELRKFYGWSFQSLKTRDFHQMAGRAGRRGIDEEGFVCSRVNPRFMKYSELERIIHGEPEKVSSRFNASYATILNLYQRYGEKLYDIYSLSFHYFQEKKNSRQRAVELLRAKVNLLKRLGYIWEGRLTEKGIFAARIYGYELSLSELYEEINLEQLPPEDLAVLALALVFEPRKGIAVPALPRRLKALQRTADGVLEQIQKMERKRGIVPLSKKCYFHLSACLEAWMKNEDFGRIHRYTDVDEGEIIRYFRMGVQVLREILETPVSPLFKEKIKSIIPLINRDVIDAEKQLRGA